MDEVKFVNFSGGYKDRILFENLNISIEKGSFTAIAGPNGSGKSTLLKYLIRELKASDNTLFICKTESNKYKQKELAQMLSFVAQNSIADYEFTVKEIVSMGLYCHDIKSQESVDKALNLAGITHIKDKLVTRISGGEFQMTMLARAICQNTDCIVLDEPVNSLDPKHQLSFLNLLKKLSKEGKTVICVLHDLNAILNYCDNCILLKDGKVFQSGLTEEVITQKTIKEVYDIDCTITGINNGKYLSFQKTFSQEDGRMT